MKTIEEIGIFSERLSNSLKKCKECNGLDKNCSCYERFKFKVEAYKACIPKAFWNIPQHCIPNGDKKSSRYAIHLYVDNLSKVFSKGYSLFLWGSNGSGKSTCGCYVLKHAIESRRTVYYTTTTDLDKNLKAGFNNREVFNRLQFMLTSDLIFFDEIGKENFNLKRTWFTSEIERILKHRYDNNKPTLIATNLGQKSFEDLYGPTIKSMISGKYKTVLFPACDFRKNENLDMEKEMGY
jgi:DNA replication protein DnaC